MVRAELGGHSTGSAIHPVPLELRVKGLTQGPKEDMATPPSKGTKAAITCLGNGGHRTSKQEMRPQPLRGWRLPQLTCQSSAALVHDAHCVPQSPLDRLPHWEPLGSFSSPAPGDSAVRTPAPPPPGPICQQSNDGCRTWEGTLLGGSMRMEGSHSPGGSTVTWSRNSSMPASRSLRSLAL